MVKAPKMAMMFKYLLYAFILFVYTFIVSLTGIADSWEAWQCFGDIEFINYLFLILYRFTVYFLPAPILTLITYKNIKSVNLVKEYNIQFKAYFVLFAIFKFFNPLQDFDILSVLDSAFLLVGLFITLPKPTQKLFRHQDIDS